MSKVVIVPNTPLAESNGSFGHHVDTGGQHRMESDGSFGHHKSETPAPMSSSVNGVTHIMPPDPRKW
ncbi:hypothetical protein JQ581_02390 [Bradyrhizobium liaoningense]|uniref:hypothetical protein n=1 Tax=Bradyrhizobium liaoningense TaxID=43992 RepID=UPI001BACEB39|nr:hypothetical protein [Bradyrhizobium liaoningense]MBR0735763.1 hypothetical protein [Bradyrhizobium liaoningense]